MDPEPVPITERLYIECNKLDGRNFAKKVVALMLEAADELRERDNAIAELRRERIEDSEVLGRSMHRVAEQAQALETATKRIEIERNVKIVYQARMEAAEATVTEQAQRLTELTEAASERDAIATLLSDRAEPGTYAKVDGLVARVRDLEAALRKASEFVDRIRCSRMASIGSIDNTYLPQLSRAAVDALGNQLATLLSETPR